MRVGRALRALVVAALLAATACANGGTSRRPPAPGHWRLVFHDEFDGSSLDTRRWATCYDWNRNGCTNSSNHEEQWYLPGQVTVGNGALSLTAVRRATRGSDGKTYPWTSGMVSTGRDHWDGRPRRTFTYGYFESAVRIPSQGGMFPAFWMMPASRHTPPELDVMEFLGSTQEVLMSTHWRGGEGARRTERGTYGPQDFPAGYHVFALLWTRHELTWFVDGLARFRVTDPAGVPHVPMEVLLDLAVGLPHSPPPSVREARMKVDWVRVWQQ
ncbi:glycoside hydrolase family 16 protein [Streptomyces sp. SLBN-8D4]|jgi:beta-glucanase (GH16 family)|uniref:glycoside hydrolase family 16 protein n=1 Tax=Streptomyces sp. SLBN-8D4 TaxID=3377728 RepID=UPI003C7994BF